MSENLNHLDTERRDLLATLAERREVLIGTTEGMTDDQARTRSTVSELTLGGLIKHVSATESGWVDFILDGPGLQPDWSAYDWDAAEANPGTEPDEVPDWVREREAEFTLADGETLAGVIAAYRTVAARTEQVIAGLESMDVEHPLPEAPWYEPGETRTARAVIAQLIGETAQHAGHADIIREAIDGKKSMG